MIAWAVLSVLPTMCISAPWTEEASLRAIASPIPAVAPTQRMVGELREIYDDTGADRIAARVGIMDAMDEGSGSMNGEEAEGIAALRRGRRCGTDAADAGDRQKREEAAKHPRTRRAKVRARLQDARESCPTSTAAELKSRLSSLQPAVRHPSALVPIISLHKLFSRRYLDHRSRQASEGYQISSRKTQ